MRTVFRVNNHYIHYTYSSSINFLGWFATYCLLTSETFPTQYFLFYYLITAGVCFPHPVCLSWRFDQRRGNSTYSKKGWCHKGSRHASHSLV